MFDALSQDYPGPLEPVEAAPKQAPAAPVSTVGDAEDERSPTHGMTLGERIAHVGGRTNAQGYVEFGSPMAVNALIQHVLRDIDCTRQDDDGAYQARYRLPGGQWSSWGHVVCGVKGHEQELRYLPGGRRPAPPAAGQQLASYDNTPAPDVDKAGQAPAASAEPVGFDRDALVDLIADHLSGTYHCTRVWEAWSVGTMSEEDFEDVGESETPSELADAIVARFAATTPPAPASLIGWMIEGSDRIWRGEDAEQVAQAEAKRIGGTCYAFPIYRRAPVQAVSDDSLRFIQRVLESDAPQSDRERAAQLVRDMRRGQPRTAVIGQTKAASAEPVPVEIERLAINRYRPVPAGALAYKVVAGDGSRSLFSGTKDECQIVARKLTEAFLDGAHVAINAAPVAAQAPAAAGDALEDYKVNGAQAARWAPSSAHWSGELCRLFGPDAREGINVLEARLRDAERDAFRYRTLRRKVSIAGGKFHILNLDPRYIAPDAAVELDATIDAAIAAQRKGDA